MQKENQLDKMATILKPYIFVYFFQQMYDASFIRKFQWERCYLRLSPQTPPSLTMGRKCLFAKIQFFIKMNETTITDLYKHHGDNNLSDIPCNYGKYS